MQQHPIPQNISAYQFRLVGDMTLKQFLEILGGIAIAALFYYTNLIGPLKWALMISSVLIGLSMAFMPIEERPLDQWLLAFIRAVYAPTLFIWKKSTQPPNYFTHTPKSTPLPPDTQTMIEAGIRRKKAGLSTFLMTLPQVKAVGSLDQSEKISLQSISNLFSTSSAHVPPQPPAGPPVVDTPQPPAGLLMTNTPQPVISAYFPTLTPPQPPAGPRLADKPQPPASQPPVSPLDSSNSVPAPAPIHIQPQPKPNQPPADPSPFTPPAAEQPQPKPQPPAGPPLAGTRPPTTPTIPAASATNLPFPSRPLTPNTVVGMVLNKGGSIVENAIIEIRDKNGQPVRATKTNKLGQFFSTTPLKNGPYELEVESPHHHFSVIKLDLKGQLIDPLKITAKD